MYCVEALREGLFSEPGRALSKRQLAGAALKTAHVKKTKTGGSQEHELALSAAPCNPDGEMWFKNASYAAKSEQKRKKWKNFKQATDPLKEPHAPEPNYFSIEAPPSTRPQNRYCDVTGLPADYVDPQTGIRYYSAATFQFVKALPTSAVQSYLQLRNAGVVLK